MEHEAHPLRAIVAGFCATLLMTLWLYAVPALGGARVDMAAMLASIFGGVSAAPGTGAWWTGMVLHFVNGAVIFPLIYAYAMYGLLLGGHPWVRGMWWGMLLFFFVQGILMPVLGGGFFSTAIPRQGIAVLVSLAGHFMYGCLFGYMAGEQAVGAVWTGWHKHA